MDQITKFLEEAFKRFTAETPWFFKVIRNLSIITAIIAGLPDLIVFLTNSGVEIPEPILLFANKTVAISAVVAAFISQFTATTKDKQVLKIKDN